MSAQVIAFPTSRQRRAPSSEAIDMLADRLVATIADLPAAEDDTLKLLRSIDRKLTKLIKAVGGAV
ncbi:hypothetical protein ACWJ7E_005953 [Pseudomonas aeruginosa]